MYKSKNKYRMWLLTAAVCALFIPMKMDAQENTQPILQTLAAGLKARNSFGTHTEGVFIKEYYPNSDKKLLGAMSDDMAEALKKGPELSQFYLSTGDGNVREDFRSIFPDNSVYLLQTSNDERSQSWSFGSDTATEVGDAKKIHIGESLRHVQFDLIAGREGLADKIGKGQVQFVRKEMIQGMEAYVVQEKTAEHNLMETWWIVPEKSCVVVKQEIKPIKAEKDGAIDSWRSVRLVDKMIQTEDGLWVPEVTRNIGYVTIAGQNVETWKAMFRFTTLSFNVKDLAEKTSYSLPLPLGTRVGGEGRETYVVGGDISPFQQKIDKRTPEQEALQDMPLSPK